MTTTSSALETPVHTGRPLSEEFDAGFEDRLTAYYCRDREFLIRAGDLVLPEQFSNKANGYLVSIVAGYFRSYKSSPSKEFIIDMIKEAKKRGKIREEFVPEVVNAMKRILTEKLEDTGYMIDRVVTFARSVAFDDAFIKAAELKEKGEFERAMQVMQKVDMVGASDMDDVYSFYERSGERHERREYEASDDFVPNSVTTGIPLLDKMLHQKGWGRKELVLFMGFAKSGKSTALREFGINATLTTSCTSLWKSIKTFCPTAGMLVSPKQKCQNLLSAAMILRKSFALWVLMGKSEACGLLSVAPIHFHLPTLTAYSAT